MNSMDSWSANGSITANDVKKEVDCISLFPEYVISATVRTVSPKHAETLLKALKEIYISGHHSDVKIMVECSEFRAHKFILSACSPVFDSMFRHEMKENASGVVVIPDCDADCFQVFLQFLYTADVSLVTVKNACRLYQIADKYEAKELMIEIVKFLKSNMRFETILDVVDLAVLHNESQLWQAAIAFCKHNFRTIRDTPDWQEFIEMKTSTAVILLEALIEMTNFKKTWHPKIDAETSNVSKFDIDTCKCKVDMKVGNFQLQTCRSRLAHCSPVFCSILCKSGDKPNKIIVIHDCDPICFKAFVMFIQTRDESHFTIENVRSLYKLAKMYEIEELKTASIKFLICNLQAESFFDVIHFVQFHGDSTMWREFAKFATTSFSLICDTPNWDELFIKHHPTMVKLLNEISQLL